MQAMTKVVTVGRFGSVRGERELRAGGGIGTIAPSIRAGSVEDVWPLVMLGPGADYTRRYMANGGGIERVQGAVEAPAPIADDEFLSEDILHNRFLSPVARACRIGRAACRMALGRFQAIAIEIFSTDAFPSDAFPSDADHTALSVRNESEIHDEPDTEATARPEAGRPMAPHEGLLADHARARRSPGRQQGDGVRARRGAHREGCAAAGCEQGSLFDAIA